MNSLGELPGDATSAAAQGPSPPRPQTSLRSVSLVTLLTLVQLLLQFATQVVLAKVFGAAGEMDAYVAALALPVVVATILSGSLGYVLVPAIAEQLEKSGEQSAAALASQIGLYLLAVAVLVSGLVTVLAEPIAAALCPGFSPDRIALTGQLLRVLSLLIVGNCLIAYLNALFHAYRRFLLPAIAGVIGTLVTLGYVILLHERQGIFAVAWGVVVGAAVTMAILSPLFLLQIFQSAGWTQPMQAGARRCLSLLVPLVLGAIYWRLDPLLDRFLGSYLPPGSIAHMGYAWRLISGLMLIGTSGLSIVAFPAIAAHAAARRPADLKAELAYALRLLLFILVPICMGLAVFSEPVVRMLFEYGRFTTEDTQAVAWLVALYVGAILGGGLGDLFSRTFYAMGDTYTPVAVNSLNFTLIAGLKFIVAARWDAYGLVAATSLFYLLNAGVLAALLLRKLSGDMLAGTPHTLLRSLVSSAIACGAASLVIRLPVDWAALPAAVCGGLVYLLVMWLWGDEFAMKLNRFMVVWRQPRGQ